MTQWQAILLTGALLMNPFEQEEKAWRKHRHERLMSEDGWLTLVGLHWLNEGVNPIENLGTFTLQKGVVRYQGKELNNDLMTYMPDVVQVGDLHAMIIRRGERF